MSGLTRIAKQENTKVTLQTIGSQAMNPKEPTKLTYVVKATVELFKPSEIFEDNTGTKSQVPGFMVKQVVVESKANELTEAQDKALDRAADLLGLGE